MFVYLRMVRPANVVTSVADVLAGAAISGAFSASQFTVAWPGILLLSISTACLYSGGIVFNDVFDLKIDKIERPERPIPSGKSTVNGAITLGTLLFVVGISSAYMISPLSGALAIIIMGLALFYNKFSKHHTFLGPINMGICRGLNLLLGMSLLFNCIAERWFIALIPVIYISSITMISRGEVHGRNVHLLKKGGFLYLLVIIIITLLGIFNDFNLLSFLPFIILFISLIFPPLLRAIKQNHPKNIKHAVKTGILSLIPLNASIASGFAGWQYGLIVLALLPLSIVIAKKFAVT